MLYKIGGKRYWQHIREPWSLIIKYASMQLTSVRLRASGPVPIYGIEMVTALPRNDRPFIA
jgi:hypothetical protein